MTPIPGESVNAISYNFSENTEMARMTIYGGVNNFSGWPGPDQVVAENLTADYANFADLIAKVKQGARSAELGTRGSRSPSGRRSGPRGQRVSERERANQQPGCKLRRLRALLKSKRRAPRQKRRTWTADYADGADLIAKVEQGAGSWEQQMGDGRWEMADGRSEALMIELISDF
jgi:hypothetical protein